jgi:phosphopantetheinyl transferase (holo-ACP synthase)
VRKLGFHDIMIVNEHGRPHGVVLDSDFVASLQLQTAVDGVIGNETISTDNILSSNADKPAADVSKSALNKSTAAVQDESISEDGLTFSPEHNVASKVQNVILPKNSMALHGRVCEVSISHEDEYAIATALVYNEDLNSEETANFPIY